MEIKIGIGVDNIYFGLNLGVLYSGDDKPVWPSTYR